MASAASELREPLSDEEIGACVLNLGSLNKREFLKRCEGKSGCSPRIMVASQSRGATPSGEGAEGARRSVGFIFLSVALPKYLKSYLIANADLSQDFTTSRVMGAWAHLLQGAHLLRVLLGAGQHVVSSKTIGRDSILPRNEDHREEVLDTIVLVTAYANGCLETGQFWEQWEQATRKGAMEEGPAGAGGGGDRGSKSAVADVQGSTFEAKRSISKLVLGTLSILEDFMTWTKSDSIFYTYVCAIAKYRKIDYLFCGSLDLLSLMVKNLRIFDIHYFPIWTKKIKHLSRYLGSHDKESQQETKWYFERLCGVTAFFTRQLVSQDLYVTHLHSPSPLHSLSPSLSLSFGE